MFERVRQGQRLNPPADAQNGLYALLEERNRRNRKGRGTGKVGDETRIKIQNKTGSALDRFGIVEVGAAIFTRTNSQATYDAENLFQGDVPSASSTQIAIVQEPLAVDAVGEAIIAGVSTCKLNVGSTSDTHASPTTSLTQLTTGTSGLAKILEITDAGTGSGKNAKVLLLNQAQSAIEYLTWYMVSDPSGKLSFSGAPGGTFITSWYEQHQYGVVDHPRFPSTGLWLVTLLIHGDIYSQTTSGAAAKPVWLRGKLEGISPNALMLAPESITSGLIAGAVATDATGIYSALGTLTLQALFEVYVADVDAVSISCYAFPHTWNASDTAPAISTIYQLMVNAALDSQPGTTLTMIKLGEL